MKQSAPYHSLDNSFRIASLIAGFLRKELTLAEETELDTWVSASEKNEELFASITGGADWPQYLAWFDEEKVAMRLQETRNKLGLSAQNQPSRLIAFRGLRYAAGIIVFISIGWLIYFLLVLSKSKEADTSQSSQAIRLNQVTAPGKSLLDIELPDGSRVWLNATSTLQYPTSFTDSSRQVILTGEAFFEVHPDPARPFTVLAGGLIISALGTAFNVSAYPDEKQITTTLIHGSVRVSDGNQQQLLQPGSQLKSNGDNWNVLSAIDTNSIIAWKENMFRFNNTDIEAVMRMIGHWYGVKIIFHDHPRLHFNGAITRASSLQQVLSLLEQTGQVNFAITDSTVTVLK